MKFPYDELKKFVDSKRDEKYGPPTRTECAIWGFNQALKLPDAKEWTDAHCHNLVSEMCAMQQELESLRAEITELKSALAGRDAENKMLREALEEAGCRCSVSLFDDAWEECLCCQAKKESE
jgi:hypothetical protein